MIGGLIFCCFGYTYGAEQLHSDNLGMLLIFISIATQIFLFIVFYNYNKNLRKGTFIVTPNGIDINFKYFDKKINIPQNVIDKCSFRNDLMQLIISLKQDLYVEINGIKKFGFITTGIVIEKQKATLLLDEINNILTSEENTIKIKNQNNIDDSFADNLHLPKEYIYRETSEGFFFEGEIPSGNFGSNPIGSIFLLLVLYFLSFFLLLYFYKKYWA